MRSRGHASSPGNGHRRRLGRPRAGVSAQLVELHVRGLREALRLSGPAGSPGRPHSPGGRKGVSEFFPRRTHCDDQAATHLPFPHRGQDHRCKLRRSDQPTGEPQHAVAGGVLLDGHRRGEGRARGKGSFDRRSQGSRSVHPWDPNHPSGRRSRSTAVDAVLLSVAARHPDRPGGGRRSCGLGPLLHRVSRTWTPAGARAQSLLPRAAKAPRRAHRVLRWYGPRSVPAGRRAERRGLLHGVICLLPQVAREYVERFGINRPGGRLFFTATSSTEAFVFNHDRRAFESPSQIPLKQAINSAIDRPALVRAGDALAGRRTDQILPPALTRPASIYPLVGVTPRSLARARALLARARFKPTKLVLYTYNALSFPVRAQIFQFNLQRLGIDVEVKYFTVGTLEARIGTGGGPSTSRSSVGGRTTRREQLLPTDPRRASDSSDRTLELRVLRSPEIQHCDRPDQRAPGRGAASRVGRTRRRDDARRSTMGPVSEQRARRPRVGGARLLRPPAGRRQAELRRGLQEVTPP